MTAVLYDSTMDLDSFTVRLVLDAFGVDHERVVVDLVPSRDPASQAQLTELGASAPPVLRLDDEVIAGTDAILRYLTEPNDADARWLDFARDELAVVRAAREASLFGVPPSEAEKQLALRVLLVLEDARTLDLLDGKDFFGGHECSIADLALYPSVALSRDLGLEPHLFPALRSWLPRVRARVPHTRMPGISDVA